MDEIIIFICLIILILTGFYIRYSKKGELISKENENSIQDIYPLKNYLSSRILFIAEIGLAALLLSIIFYNLKFYLMTLWSVISFMIVLKMISFAKKS